MKVISARSPYQIIINEAGQTGSKVELFIWNKGTTEPTIPTYIMSENIASITQTETNYNISPYILEYINLINPTKILLTAAQEENTAWCFVKVKRYKLIGTSATLLNTVSYVGVNGFTKVSDGLNFDKSTSNLILLLSNKNINNNYDFSAVETPYVNVIIDKVIDKTLTATYERNDGIAYSVVQNLLAGESGIFNLKIPLTLVVTDGTFINGCKLTLSYQTVGLPIVNVFNSYPIEECKYTPVECSFINSFGGWQFLTFFKAQTNSINIKGSEYNLMQSNVNYNPLIGQRKSFNINGTQTIKLNTGWVAENYSELIKDLLISEIVLLDNIPVNVKTQSLTYKTNILDKNINYEIDFDYANNLLNNIV
jgi:hypothetical protein